MRSTLFFEGALEKERAGMGCVLCTLLSCCGRTPRKQSRMLVFSDGSTSGTVGGGPEEAEVRRKALLAMKSGRSQKMAYSVRGKGEMEVYMDVIREDRKAVLFSSGHVAKALYEALSFLGYQITIVDPREELNTEERFPDARRVADYRETEIDENTALVIFDPDSADEILSSFPGKAPFYVGVMSSRSRTFLDSRITTPVGVDIGSETPEEIAISIAAEIEARRKGRNAGFLSSGRNRLVVVRGGGDLATGTIIRLRNAGYKVVSLEVPEPTVIRRTVSFAQCMFDGEMTVDGSKARRCERIEDVWPMLDEDIVPVLADPKGEAIKVLKPLCVVDAIIAKRNLGTTKDMAPLVIALGPGFSAGEDCDVVIETQRGHDLGRLIYEGPATPNSGIPGIIGGVGKDRVIHSSCAGVIREVNHIGDIVEKDDVIGYIDETPIHATISGRIRGFITPGMYVPKDFKIIDIDPRGKDSSYLTPSDKARAIAGGVLEALDSFVRRHK